MQEYEESTVTALQRLDRRAAGTEHALDMHQEARRLDDEENRSKFGQLASRLQVLEEKEANGLGRGDDSVSQPLSDSRERALTGFVEREVDRVRAMLESRSVTDTKVYDALKQDIQSMSEKYNRTLSITVALEARCRDLEVALQQAPKVSGHTPVVTPRSTVFAPGDDQGKVEPGETPELKTPSWGSADELTAPRTPRRSLFNAPVAQEMTPDAVEKSSRWDLHSFQGDAADKWYHEAYEEEKNAAMPMADELKAQPLPSLHAMPTTPRRGKSRDGSQERSSTTIPAGAWKLLKDVPKLQAPRGQPWESGLQLNQWLSELTTIAMAIHPTFKEYLAAQLRQANHRYEQRQIHGGAPMDEVQVRPQEEELETRLSLTLVRLLPEQMRRPAIEMGLGDRISSVNLLEAVFEQYAPGGVAEKTSLTTFLRGLPTAKSFTEVLATLRRLRLAKARAEVLKLPPIPAHEMLQSLSSVVRDLEKRAPTLHKTQHCEASTRHLSSHG